MTFKYLLTGFSKYRRKIEEEKHFEYRKNTRGGGFKPSSLAFSIILASGKCASCTGRY